MSIKRNLLFTVIAYTFYFIMNQQKNLLDIFRPPFFEDKFLYDDINWFGPGNSQDKHTRDYKLQMKKN